MGSGGPKRPDQASTDVVGTLGQCDGGAGVAGVVGQLWTSACGEPENEDRKNKHQVAGCVAAADHEGRAIEICKPVKYVVFRAERTDG